MIIRGFVRETTGLFCYFLYDFVCAAVVFHCVVLVKNIKALRNYSMQVNCILRTVRLLLADVQQQSNDAQSKIPEED